MSNSARLERVSKRTYRVRGAQRTAQDSQPHGAPDARGSRFAILSRFATGSQRQWLPKRSAGP